MASGRMLPRHMALDWDDQFRTSCMDSKIYPCNLLGARYSTSTLQTFYGKLDAAENRLFDDEDETVLHFLEQYDGSRGRLSTHINLKAHTKTL